MSDIFRSFKSYAIALAIATAYTFTPSSAAAACIPGTYNPVRGVQIGDCYAASELNTAMKDFGQRTFMHGQRIAMSGKRHEIGGREYTDRQVVNIYVANLDEAKNLQALESIKKERGIPEAAAWKRLKDVMELSSLEFRALAEHAKDLRLTVNSDGNFGLVVEGNSSFRQTSSEWRILATLHQPRIYNPDSTEASYDKAFGSQLSAQVRSAGDRLMVAGTFNNQLFFIVRNPVAAKHADFYVRRADGTVTDLGHITDIDYTDLGKIIINQPNVR